MAADRTSENVNLGAVQARTRDGNLAALSAVQQATSGKGSGLDVKSDNVDAPVIVARGAGDLLVLRNADGTAKLTAAQSGALTVAGAVTVTGAVHATSSAFGVPSPVNHGLVAWSFDPSVVNTGTQLTNGTVYLSALYIPRDVSVTKIYWHVTTSGATPTAGQNEVGLFSSAGTRLAATNVDAVISASGMKTTTISSVALTAGSFYWVGMVFNAATAPTVARGTGLGSSDTLTNVGLTAATYRYATNGTGQTALAASITPGSNTAGTFGGPWVALGV